jgi:hypothetical protein
MPVRWWSDIDQDTRFVLLEESFKAAASIVRQKLKKKGGEKNLAKRALLKFPDRDWEAMRNSVPILYPIKIAIKELEGANYF